MLIGYKKVNIVDNDRESSLVMQVFSRDYVNMPTEEEEAQACKDYDLDYVEKRLVKSNLFQ